MKKHIDVILMLAAALATTAALGAQEATTPAENVNPAVIEVNGEKIYAAEISMTMQNIAAQAGGRENVESEQALVGMATERVVEQTLLAQEARRTNIQPNELRMAQMIQAIEKQAGGREALETSLAGFGMSYDQLVGFIREMELSRSLIEKQIMPTISVSDEEVRAFYAENPELFEAEEQVHARHILISTSLDADAETVVAHGVRAEQARQRAVAGEDFAALARELSEGPSAQNGGDLGFIVRGQTAPTFIAAAFALEPGGISPIVRTEFGFHVIKVEEKRPAGLLPLDDVFDRVKNLLLQQKTGQRVGQFVESLADKATVLNLIDGSATAAAPQ